jgi:hypothetical protein
VRQRLRSACGQINYIPSACNIGKMPRGVGLLYPVYVYSILFLKLSVSQSVVYLCAIVREGVLRRAYYHQVKPVHLALIHHPPHQHHLLASKAHDMRTD